MKTELTNEQITFYQDQGCLVLDQFLTDEELDGMRAAVSASVDQMGDKKVAGESDLRDPAPDSYYAKMFLQRQNLWKINDFVRGFFLNPQLGRMLCRLSGNDGIRMWHDQTLQKRPWANPTAWHLDNPYWSFYSTSAISIWIALDDATLANGCMSFIPGSHKVVDPHRLIKIDQQMDDLMQAYPELAEMESVQAPLQAGACTFHNGILAHGAGANMTRGWRRAMTCAFMPEGAVFNGQQNVLPRDYYESLKVGDVLKNDEQNPLLWSQTMSEAT